MHAPTAEAIAERLEGFLRERYQVSPDDALFSRRVNLWEEGYVNSAGVVEVLAFLEETYGVRIPDELLFDPSFTTIEGMAQKLGALLAARGGS